MTAPCAGNTQRAPHDRVRQLLPFPKEPFACRSGRLEHPVLFLESGQEKRLMFSKLVRGIVAASVHQRTKPCEGLTGRRSAALLPSLLGPSDAPTPSNRSQRARGEGFPAIIAVATKRTPLPGTRCSCRTFFRNRIGRGNGITGHGWVPPLHPPHHL